MAAPPESTKNSLLHRLHTHARNNWPQITDLDLRYRGQFAYVQAELANGTTQPLIRLRYGGSARHWGFGLYLASSNKYENQILPSGLPIGSLEEALDCACSLYLDNNPPDNRTNPRRTSNSDHLGHPELRVHLVPVGEPTA